VDPFQLFNEMFEREFTRPMGSAGSMFGDDPAFANHQRMADTNGFGFGSVGFGGGMPSMSEMDPFASHGSNSTAATRRGEAGLPSSFGTFSSSMNGSMKGSNFQSESRSTRTINGRTETVVRKVDGQVRSS
jgi:DnaJ family protein B protein 6